MSMLPQQQGQNGEFIIPVQNQSAMYWPYVTTDSGLVVYPAISNVSGQADGIQGTPVQSTGIGQEIARKGIVSRITSMFKA